MKMQEMPASTERKAERTCRYCRVRKQRCDKTLPRCSRCVSKLVKCDYSEELPTAASLVTEITRVEPLAILQDFCRLDLTSTGEQRLLRAACGGHESSGSIVETEQSLTRLVKEILATGGTSFNGVSNAYFTTARDWIPILNEAKVNANVRVLDEGAKYSDDVFSLLLLCMFILTRPLCDHPNHGAKNALYRTTRRLFLIIETSTQASLLTRLQAGLFLAAYECGHGLFTEASTTLAMCFGLARQIDITDMQDAESETDRNLCWFGIIFLDRAIALSNINSSPSLLIPSSQFLPLNAAPKIPKLDWTNMSIVEKFSKRAYTALILGDTIATVFGDPYSPDCAAAEKALHELIRQHVESAPGESYPVCEGLSMALSAVVSAYKKRTQRHGLSEDPKLALDIKFTHNIVFDMCRVEGSLMWNRDTRLGRIFFSCLSCLYHAAVELNEICPDRALPEDLEQLRDNLAWFSRNWKVGEVLLQRLDRNSRLRTIS